MKNENAVTVPKSGRIGLFGGTFSPPHLGHIRAAKLFIEAESISQLIVMPSHIPPHKALPDGAADKDRLAMARLAFGSFAEVSDWEMKQGKKSYTVDTLRMLKSAYPESDIFMLIGEDMLECFDRWRSPREIASLATVCYMRRSGTGRLIEAERRFEEVCGCPPRFVGREPLVLSSTVIRETVSRGGDASQMLSDAVYGYIKEMGLYKK